MMYKTLLIFSILFLCLKHSYAQPAMEMSLTVEFFPQEATFYSL